MSDLEYATTVELIDEILSRCRCGVVITKKEIQRGERVEDHAYWRYKGDPDEVVGILTRTAHRIMVTADKEDEIIKQEEDDEEE